jgi:hypothetical protein
MPGNKFSDHTTVSIVILDVLLWPNHAVVDRLLFLLEQVLEDELAPSAAACVHQRATLVELSQLDG